MKRLLLSLAALLPTVAYAAMPLEVEDSSKDSVGGRLIYQVKEKVRASSSLKLTYDTSTPRLQARFVTLDGNKNGRSTVYSLVLTWDRGDDSLPLYLTQVTGLCGSSLVSECADDLVADISRESDKIISVLQNSSER